jgi:hypothetical protein
MQDPKPIYEAPRIESFTDEAILAELGGGVMSGGAPPASPFM